MNVNRAVGEKRLFDSTALLSFASVYPSRFTEAKFCNLSQQNDKRPRIKELVCFPIIPITTME
jgi:hypothetical protein